MQRDDDSLRGMTGYLLRRASAAAMPGVTRVLEPFGLRRTSFSSLVIIVARPGLNQGQLADALAIERPNIVQIIDQLEGAKLVQRTRSPEDRRAYALMPTGKGRTLAAQATRALQDYESDLTRGLSESDLATLHRCLQVIEQNTHETEIADARDVQVS